MNVTLEKIMDGFSTQLTALKTKKGEVDTAKKAVEEAADDKAKEKAEADLALKEKEFHNLKTNLTNEIREEARLSLFSKEVADRRKNRKMEAVEKDISKVEDEIDSLTLKMSQLDQEIAEVRKKAA